MDNPSYGHHHPRAYPNGHLDQKQAVRQRTPTPTLAFPLAPTAKHLSQPSSSSTSPADDATHLPYSPSSPHSFTRAPSLSSLSSSSYAGSADGESIDTKEVDLVALLTEKLAGAFDPLQLDRSLAVQAQTSGMLNSKTRELIALQEEAQARLAETRKSFLEGMKVAKEVKSDLEYVHRRVKVLKQKTERKYPVEYNMARDRIPTPPQ